MTAIVAKAVDDGAFGFSTNRYEPHKGPDGRSIPGTFAEVQELEEIARQVGPRRRAALHPEVQGLQGHDRER